MSDIVFYDIDNSVVSGKVTAYRTSLDDMKYEGRDDVIIKPDLSSVIGISQLYWKVESSSIVEMTETEKKKIDKKIPKSKEFILGKIETSASSLTQINRLMDALDTNAMFLAALDKQNYGTARMRANKALTESSINQSDYDLIDEILPDLS